MQKRMGNSFKSAINNLKQLKNRDGSKNRNGSLTDFDPNQIDIDSHQINVGNTNLNNRIKQQDYDNWYTYKFCFI